MIFCQVGQFHYISNHRLVYMYLTYLVSIYHFLLFLKQMDIQIFSATEKANNVYTCCDFNKPLLLIMGAEDKGISKDCLRMSDELIKIPLQGEIESLNVSVATGVCLFEIVRQRLAA